MNIKKLAALAKTQHGWAHNGTLVYLSQQWSKHAKCGDSVTAAIKCNVLRTVATSFMCAFWSLLGICLITDQIHMEVVSNVSFLLMPVSLAASVLFYVRSRNHAFDDARRFCEAISLLEGLCGPLDHKSCDPKSKWNIHYNLGQLQNAAHMVLQGQAAKVKKYQSVPWEVKMTDQMRKGFGRKIGLLHHLLSVPMSWDTYFKTN